MFLVFVYIWLPYMILPIQAALERVPATSSRPRPISARSPRQTFRTVILPLALPGLVAGSIFTFSLTLGDYIIPQIVGHIRASSSAQVVYAQRARPATFRWRRPSRWCRSSSWALYLAVAKRLGAFDAL